MTLLDVAYNTMTVVEVLVLLALALLTFAFVVATARRNRAAAAWRNARSAAPPSRASVIKHQRPYDWARSEENESGYKD